GPSRNWSETNLARSSTFEAKLAAGASAPVSTNGSTPLARPGTRRPYPIANPGVSRAGAARVAVVPSGGRVGRSTYCGHVSPETCATTSPARETARLEYFHSCPGAKVAA